jgi:hypothetical protein
MKRALVKLSKVKPPAGLKPLFDDPPLVGDEKWEDYDNFFSLVAADFSPRDVIEWLYTRDFTDLSWEIRRERKLKLVYIKSIDGKVEFSTPPWDPIDASDRRIASYELRRMAVLRMMAHYDETLARRFKASADVIERQFSEAAE